MLGDMVWYIMVLGVMFLSSESEEKMECCDVCGDLMDSLKKCANCKKVSITFTCNTCSVVTHFLLLPIFFSLPPSLLYTLSPSFAPSLLSFLPHSFASPSLLSSLLPFSLPPLPDAGILLQCGVSEVGLVRW